MFIRLFLALVLVYPPQLWANDSVNPTEALNEAMTSLPAAGAPSAAPCPNQILSGAPEHVRTRVLEAMRIADEQTKKLSAAMDAMIASTKQVAEECPTSTAASCPALGRLVKSAFSFVGPLEIAFRTELKAKNPHAEPFLRSLISELTSTLSPRTLRLENLRSEDKPGEDVISNARRNYFKTLAWVYLFQGMAVMANVFSNEKFDGSAVIPILFNTFVMITLQTDKGAKNTEQRLNLPEPNTIDELNAQMPGFLAGAQGYVPETKKKFAGFLALFPVEVTFVMLAAVLQELLSPKGGGATFAENTPATIAAVTALSIGIFGTYLAARWAMFDYWFNLRYWPALHKLKKRQVAQVDEEILNLLETHGVIARPEVDSTLTFIRHSIGALGFGEAKRPPQPNVGRFTLAAIQNALGTRTRAFAQVYRDWAQQRQTYAAWNTEFGDRYQSVLATDEGKRLAEERLKVARGLKTAVAIEGAYRFGLTFFDSYIIFGLMGHWVPDFVRYLFQSF
jgi:hypothetical protein